MDIDDDRTDAEKRTHTCLIGGTDRFMSGWGKAKGGQSIALWACPPEYRDRVRDWVYRSSDIGGPDEYSDSNLPTGLGHCHIYSVGPDHPAMPR